MTKLADHDGISNVGRAACCATLLLCCRLKALQVALRNGQPLPISKSKDPTDHASQQLESVKHPRREIPSITPRLLPGMDVPSYPFAACGPGRDQRQVRWCLVPRYFQSRYINGKFGRRLRTNLSGPSPHQLSVAAYRAHCLRGENRLPKVRGYAARLSASAICTRTFAVWGNDTCPNCGSQAFLQLGALERCYPWLTGAFPTQRTCPAKSIFWTML